LPFRQDQRHSSSEAAAPGVFFRQEKPHEKTLPERAGQADGFRQIAG
jgi:hypothetical protein